MKMRTPTTGFLYLEVSKGIKKYKESMKGNNLKANTY